jgi:hypothetical protein
MLFIRHRLLVGLVGLVSLSAVTRVQAGLLYEPNNTASLAAPLPIGSLTASASLDPVEPETILGEFDPAYHTLLHTSPSATGAVTEWDGLPLLPNGSQYFRVSGIGDVNFTGDHTQTGKFMYEFKVYDAAHDLLQTILGSATIFAKTATNNGSVKNIWVNPPPAPAVGAPPSPQIGGSVDVIVTDLVTKGDVDFYSFSGLQPGQSFTANINAAGFQPRLGLWTDPTTRGPTVDGSILTAHADSSGHVLIGVTGQGDTNFTGAQTAPGQYAAGNYTLAITPTPTPEPAGIVLLGLGGMLAFLFRQYGRSRRPLFDPARLG